MLFHYYTYLVDDDQLPIEVLQPTMPHWVPDDTAVADLTYQWLADRLVKARQHFILAAAERAQHQCRILKPKLCRSAPRDHPDLSWICCEPMNLGNLFARRQRMGEALV